MGIDLRQGKILMIMGDADRQRFPRSARLISTLDGSLPRKVRDAFIDACTAPIQRRPVAVAKRIATTQALPFAVGPRIRIVAGLVRRPEAGKVVEVCGFTNSFVSPTIIEITDIYFNAFEFGLAPTDQTNNAARLTRTLLHELVHWVREQAKATDDVDMSFKQAPVEAGVFFEQLAFGNTPLCDNANIEDAILSVRKP